jgi:hypothetical protein
MTLIFSQRSKIKSACLSGVNEPVFGFKAICLCALNRSQRQRILSSQPRRQVLLRRGFAHHKQSLIGRIVAGWVVASALLDFFPILIGFETNMKRRYPKFA